MAKNKSVAKFSARDLLLKYQKEDIKETTGLEKEREKDIEVSAYNENFNEKIIKYNQDILNLDEDYKSLNPLRKVIVRVFLKEMQKTENGLLLPNVVTVKKQTQSGYGYVGEVEAPPYSKKAVIVATPETYKDYLPVGSTVYLENEVIEATTTGASQEARVIIKNAFIHPDANLFQIPEEPDNKHYGYLKINYDAIEFIDKIKN